MLLPLFAQGMAVRVMKLEGNNPIGSLVLFVHLKVFLIGFFSRLQIFEIVKAELGRFFYRFICIPFATMHSPNIMTHSFLEIEK